MPSGVYVRKPRPVTPFTIRYLRADEPRPEGEPRRYVGWKGYVRLRWKVGVRSYVELLEHRAVAAVDPDRHVHHIDHDPTNNDPSNLVELSADEHRALHGREHQRFDRALAADLYRLGWSTTEIGRYFGVRASSVSLGLRAIGVEMRPRRRYLVPVDVTEIIRLHHEGRPATWIARHLGTTREIVIRRLRSAGLTLHRPGRPEARRVA